MTTLRAKWLTALALGLGGCSTGTSTATGTVDAQADGTADDVTTLQPVQVTWDQLTLGCALMGEGAAQHVMCNHGHAVSLHGESLYERYLYLKDHGLDTPNEAQMMAHGKVGAGTLPEPLTPLIRARLGEHVRIRVISYGGTQFHTFHLHGHLWDEGNGQLVDNVTLGPMTVEDHVKFFAGGSFDSPTERGGIGDWMYHCHVEVHALTGMWGLFRVLPQDPTASVGEDAVDATGRYPHQLALPDGQPSDTREVYVVAAEVPLTVARTYSPADKTLDPLQRVARLYVPVDLATFATATADSVGKIVAGQEETWTPWVLSLWQGQTVHVHLKNVMDSAPVTLHPHGVKYANSEDGTMPEDVALPGGPEVTMTWTGDTPGTWPLHDHARAIENIGRGLFAAIVVQDPKEAAGFQRDYILFLHDFDMDWLMGAAEPTGASH
jgi:FtsP/CotA-like multicopper oxidase with cupredoxin domain